VVRNEGTTLTVESVAVNNDGDIVADSKVGTTVVVSSVGIIDEVEVVAVKIEETTVDSETEYTDEAPMANKTKRKKVFFEKKSVIVT